MTMDVTIKTLDGQNRSYSIPENLTVKQFKDRIASSINITSDVQRLIFQGRVLQDEKQLKEYAVHGKVIHVVQRPPPGSRPPTSGTATTSSSSSTSSSTSGANANVNSFVVGSFALPSDAIDANHVQNIVQQAMNNLGEVGRNARISTRQSADGSQAVHINLGQIAIPVAVSESQERLENAKRMLKKASETLDKLENPSDSTQTNAHSPMDTSNETSSSSNTESSSATGSQNTQSTSSTEAEATNQETEATSQETEASSQTESSAGNTSSNGQSTNGTQRNTEPNHPPTTALADFIDEVSALNRRLQPHLDRYQTILRENPTFEGNSSERREAERTCNMVSEVLHYVSHCNHGISDLMVDMNQAPPRVLRAPPSTSVRDPAAILQQSIPVQAQINISSPLFHSHAASPSPATASGTRPTPTSSTAGSTGAQQQSTQTSASTTPPGHTHSHSHAHSHSHSAGHTASTSSPYVFMEVGPDSVTINSISAQVVTSSVDPTAEGGSARTGRSTGSTTGTPSTTTTTTSTGTSGGQTGSPRSFTMQMGGEGSPVDLGPNFMQNLIQMMGQSMSPGGREVMVIPGMPPLGLNITGTQPRSTTGSTTTTTRPSATTGTTSRTTTTTQPGSSSSSTARPGVNTTPLNAPINLAALSGLSGLSGSFGAFVPPSGRPGNGGPHRMGGPSVGRGHVPFSTSSSNGVRFPPGQPGHRVRGPRPAAFMMPGGPIPGLGRPVDPYLPCQSRHFLNQSLSQDQEAAENPESSLADVVTNLVQGLIGQTVQASGNSATSSSNNTASTSSDTSNAVPHTGASTQTTPSQQGPIPANSFAGLFAGMPGGSGGGASWQTDMAQMLRGVVQGAQTPGRSGTPPSSSTGSATRQGSESTGATVGAVLTDEVFTELVSGIGDYVTRSAMGQQPQDSIADFLNRIGQNHNILPGEGFVNDIFMCLATHMTFPDLISVFYGQPTPLTGLRGPLREFIRDNVLQGAEYSSRNVNEAAERLVTELQPTLRDALEGASVRTDVDVIATISNFTRQQLVKVIDMIMRSRAEDPQFGPDLMNCCRRSLGEFIVLGRYCLTGGMPAFERIVQDRLRRETSGINPMIQQWMIAMSSQQLTALSHTIDINEDAIREYIVAPSSEAPPVSSTVDSKDEATVTSTEKVEESRPSRAAPRPVSAPVFGSHEAMEVDCAGTEPAQSAVSSSTSRRSRHNVTAPRANTPATSTAEAGVRQEDWHSLVPADWVPIITADVERQRRQAPQTPFSDGYLNGMPSKRRKMMTDDKPREDLSQEGEFIPEALKRAVAAAQVEPISSLDNMVAEASEDSALQTAFQGQVEGMIRTRLQTDTDFSSEKYPNSEEYFKQEKK